MNKALQLVEDLELNHEYCPKEVILQAAAELRRLDAVNQAFEARIADIETKLAAESMRMNDIMRIILRAAIAKAEGDQQ